MRIEPFGHLDRVVDGRIEGWAIEPENDDDCAEVDILIDGMLVTTLTASLYREDVAAANIRAGYAAFRYQLPKRFADGCAHQLDVRHSSVGSSIGNSPITIQFGIDPKTRADANRARAIGSLVKHDGTRRGEFKPKLAATRKLALVSTYHNLRKFLNYQRRIFESLMDAGFVVVVIHAADDTVGTDAMSGDVSNCFLVVKSNTGYDFGSWAIGLFSVWESIETVDEMLLINDSILEVRPNGIADLIARARATSCDFVGVTDSYEAVYHLQSYFIWLGRRACRSAALHEFMSGLSFTSDKRAVIKEGELALTSHLMDAGYSAGCLHPYEHLTKLWLNRLDRTVRLIDSLPEIRPSGTPAQFKIGLIERLEQITEMIFAGTPINPSHFFWDCLIEDGCFLIKRELIFKNPSRVPTLFRLESLLPHDRSIQSDMLDLRRRYGGDLIPLFWVATPATSNLQIQDARAVVTTVTKDRLRSSPRRTRSLQGRTLDDSGPFDGALVSRPGTFSASVTGEPTC